MTAEKQHLYQMSEVTHPVFIGHNTSVNTHTHTHTHTLTHTNTEAVEFVLQLGRK